MGPGYDLVEHVRLLRASAYVVDGSRTRSETENLIEAIRDRIPKARLLVMEETLKDGRVFPYLRAGVKGLVKYQDARHDLGRAIKAVVAGGLWVPRRQLARFVDWIFSISRSSATLGVPGYLSRREREVLITVLHGFSNKEITAKLHISERTVKFHVSKLLAKFGAQRRAGLILKHFRVWPAPC